MIRNSGFVIIFLLATVSVEAQTMLKAMGELVSTSQVKVNGCSAVSGTSVFSGDRISTAQSGIAILNLGKAGRLELVASTDLTLQVSDSLVSGELHSGRMVLATPGEVSLSILTAKGIITSDGQQPVTVKIEIDPDEMRVRVYRGQAGFISGSTSREVRSGEELVLNKAGMMSGQAMQATRSQVSHNWVGLVSAGISFWLTWLVSGKECDADRAVDDTITCRDYFRNLCYRRGTVSP